MSIEQFVVWLVLVVPTVWAINRLIERSHRDYVIIGAVIMAGLAEMMSGAPAKAQAKQQFFMPNAEAIAQIPPEMRQEMISSWRAYQNGSVTEKRFKEWFDDYNRRLEQISARKGGSTRPEAALSKDEKANDRVNRQVEVPNVPSSVEIQ